jgi:hypothetical protein
LSFKGNQANDTLDEMTQLNCVLAYFPMHGKRDLHIRATGALESFDGELTLLHQPLITTDPCDEMIPGRLPDTQLQDTLDTVAKFIPTSP